MILNQLINYCDRNSFFVPNTYSCSLESCNHIVTIDMNGNFIEMNKYKGNKGEVFLNPCTIDSSTKTNAGYKKPDPFFNKIKHIFPKECNYNFNDIYILDNLSKFNMSIYSIPQTKAIENFYRNSIITVKDQLGESIKDDKVANGFILFEIKDSNLDTTHTWDDCNIKKNWSNFYITCNTSSQCDCVVSGEKTVECSKNQKIKALGSPLITGNQSELFYDGLEYNKINIGIDSSQKITASINHLIADKRHNINHYINKSNIYTLFFSDVQSKSDDDKITEFINSLDTMEFIETDSYNEDVDEKLVDYIKTNNYNESYLKNRNYNIYIFELSKTSEGTAGILNEDIISVGTVFDSLDFWKKNFCYQTYDKETGGYVMKCPSYGFILRTVFGKNDKKDSMYKCIRQCLMNAILKNSLIPASVMKYIENKTLSLMGNYFENHYRIEKLENILLAMNTYNSKKTP